MNDGWHYYNYGWMSKTESPSVTNYVAIGTLAVVLVALVYLLAGTKLVKFIQFFLTKKNYKRLDIKVSQKPSEEQEFSETPAA